MIGSEKFNKLCNTVVDIIYPWHCRICGIPAKHAICAQCLPLLPHCQQACRVCGLPLTDPNSSLCGQCLCKPPYFDSVLASFWFLPPVDQFIIDYKYHQRWENLSLLATLCIDHYPPIKSTSCVIAMPSHPKRVRQRGFNAVYELLKAMHAHMRFSYSLNSVVRIRNTETQTGKGRIERQHNIRHAFAIKKLPATDHVIIFDDVITTGATVNELARIIKSAGIDRVDVWALARAIK